jgi:hypothetical protein
MKTAIPWIIALVALTAALWAWYHPNETERVVTEYRDRTKTVFVKVKVPIEGGAVVGTGDTIQGNPVIAKADCPKSSTGSEVVTTITPSTGEVHVLVRPKKVKLIGFEDDMEIGLRFGLKPENDLFARWTFLRVGVLHFALYGEANTLSESNAMLEVSYRW